MPRHQQVTICRKSGDHVSKFCTCEPCTLAVCAVCHAYEGSLTTDCPGERVSFDKQQEVYETRLDFSDARGWHQGEPMERRSSRFEAGAARGDEQAVVQAPPTKHLPHIATNEKAPRIIGCVCGWQMPQGVSDSENAFSRHAATTYAPSTARVDHTMDLQHELSQKAIAWVLADRIADDHSAKLTRLEDEAGAHKGRDPNAQSLKLLELLEHARDGFRLADQRAQKCDDEFRQAARKLVAVLEKRP